MTSAQIPIDKFFFVTLLASLPEVQLKNKKKRYKTTIDQLLLGKWMRSAVFFPTRLRRTDVPRPQNNGRIVSACAYVPRQEERKAFNRPDVCVLSEPLRQSPSAFLLLFFLSPTHIDRQFFSGEKGKLRFLWRYDDQLLKKEKKRANTARQKEIYGRRISRHWLSTPIESRLCW